MAQGADSYPRYDLLLDYWDQTDRQTPQTGRRVDITFRELAIAELVRRAVGSPGSQPAADPYRSALPCDDLVKGRGTPPGFETRIFYVEVKENDPRLTEQGIKTIGENLREAAFRWLREQLKEDPTRLACRNPVIKVVSHDGPTADPLMARRLFIVVEVYTFPALLPPVLGASEGEG